MSNNVVPIRPQARLFCHAGGFTCSDCGAVIGISVATSKPLLAEAHCPSCGFLNPVLGMFQPPPPPGRGAA